MAPLSSTLAPIGQFAHTPVRRLGLIIAGVGTIALAAKTQVWLEPVPITLQTLALMTIFALSGLRLSLEIVFAYLAAGLMGLAVFAGPFAGPAYFVGPTAGFLLGFVVAAGIVGMAADRGLAKNPMAMFGAMLVADAAIFGLGFLWLGFLFTAASGNTLGAETAYAAGVKPFLLADLLKLVLASLAAAGISMAVKKRG